MKTLTLRVDEDTYELLKKAAEGQKRTLSNLVEYAAVSYVTSDMAASDQEMDEILQDSKLLASLRSGLKEARKGNYTIVS